MVSPEKGARYIVVPPLWVGAGQRTRRTAARELRASPDSRRARRGSRSGRDRPQAAPGRHSMEAALDQPREPLDPGHDDVRTRRADDQQRALRAGDLPTASVIQAE